MKQLAISPIFRIVGIGAALTLIGANFLGVKAGNTATAQSPNISSNINDYICAKLDDFSAIMKVVPPVNNEAAAKVNKDFGLFYTLKGDVKVQYKEENKLRLDARIKTSNAVYIMNGYTQFALVPSFHISSKTSLGNEPGKRKTLLDVGMISRGYMAYSNAEYKGTGVVNGVTCAKFKLTFKGNLDTSHRLVWIDPVSKVTLKREDYSQKGKLNVTYMYMDPKQVAPGIWFPTHVSAYNNEGEKVGELSYNEIKVNQGIEDSVFEL